MSLSENIVNNSEISNKKSFEYETFKDNFIIKQGRFEGPYTKVLELIENKKLSISEISLAQIADEYITYVKSLNEVDTMDLSKFIQVASTLMLIKAKSLLPNLEYTEEEKDEVHTLAKKLELYKVLKDAENIIKNNFEKNIMFSRDRTIFMVEKNEFPFNLNIANIISVGLLTLAKLPNYERLKNVAVRQAIRIEEVIEKLISRISNTSLSLKSFAKDVNGDINSVKKNIIVSFIALLELLKHGKVEAVEKDGDIEILGV